VADDLDDAGQQPLRPVLLELVAARAALAARARGLPVAAADLERDGGGVLLVQAATELRRVAAARLEVGLVVRGDAGVADELISLAAALAAEAEERAS
jgi:hypothetical protein